MNSFTFILISKETKKIFFFLFLGLLAVFWYFILCSIKFELSFQLKEKKNSYYKYTGPLFSVTLQNSSHILKTKNSSLNKAFLLNDTFSSFLFFVVLSRLQWEKDIICSILKNPNLFISQSILRILQLFFIWGGGGRTNPSKCLHCYKYFTMFVNINDSI